MRTEIQAVLFDLDGIITDTADFHYKAWKELAELIGIKIDRAFNEQLKGVSRMESLERILIHGGVSEQYSEADKLELANNKNNQYVELIKGVTPQDILPGITELLDTLKARGIKTAIASASKNAAVVLDGLKLAHYFDAIADAANVKHGKPDPEIFLLAAKLVHASPLHCIGIEDSQAGIESIKAASMFAIGVGSKDILFDADFVVSDTSQLTFDTILDEYKHSK